MELRQRRIRVVLVSALALLGASAIAFVALIDSWQRDLRRAVTEFEREVGPLDEPPPWTRTPRGSELGDDSAAKWLIAGADAIELEESEDDVVSEALFLGSPREWTAAEATAVRAVVTRHAPALATMSRAVPLADWAFPVRYEDPTERPWEWRPPKVSTPPSPDDAVGDLAIRQFRSVRLARVAGGLALHDRDCEAASGYVELLARQAVVLGRVPDSVTALFAYSSATAALELGRETLAECLATEHVERLLLAFAEMDRHRPPPERVLGYLAIPLVQEVRAEHRACQRDGLGCRLRGWLAPPWRGAEARWLDVWRALVVASREPWPEVLREAIELEYGRRWWQRDDYFVMVNTLEGVRSAQAITSAVRLGRVAVAARLAGLRDGAYPAADDLPAFAREPTPFQGEVPAYQATAEGARVWLPQSADVWTKVFVDGELRTPEEPLSRRPMPFEWSLPSLPSHSTDAAGEPETSR